MCGLQAILAAFGTWSEMEMLGCVTPQVLSSVSSWWQLRRTCMSNVAECRGISWIGFSEQHCSTVRGRRGYGHTSRVCEKKSPLQSYVRFSMRGMDVNTRTRNKKQVRSASAVWPQNKLKKTGWQMFKQYSKIKKTGSKMLKHYVR